MMSLELHQNAKESFNARGSFLLARIRASSERARDPGAFGPDVYVSGELTDKDIVGGVGSAVVDGTGAELARYFSEGSNEVGLEGQDYREFERLIESIHRTPTFRETISQARLKDVTFDWFRDSRKLVTRATLCDYILEVCRPEIRNYEVAIPIAMLSVEIPFPVGRATIRPLTKQLLDEWFQPFIDKARDKEEERALEESLTQRRKELQGYSAAFVSVQAERTRAEEVALQEAEVALGLLRYFAGASLVSQLSCVCVPLGKENIDKFQAISFCEGALAVWSERVVSPHRPGWTIGASEVARMRGDGLDALSQIYTSPKTEFHRNIIDAVLLFSRVAIAHELSDKLVILLASLESLFLKDESEPIQQSLGERFALVTGQDLEQRKEILAITRRVYRLRSRFVHHGEGIDDVALLNKFMFYAWCGILNIIFNRDRFDTVEAFLEKVDERRLA